MKYLVWPEGEPQRAVVAKNWLGKQWLLGGPMGWKSTLRSKRLTWMEYHGFPTMMGGPAELARRHEADIALFTRYMESLTKKA